MYIPIYTCTYIFNNMGGDHTHVPAAKGIAYAIPVYSFEVLVAAAKLYCH